MTSSDPRLAYGGLPVMVWTTGSDRECDYVNERWLEFTGRSAAEALGWGWADGIHPDDREATLHAYEVAAAERRAFDVEYRYRRKDGEYRWILATARPRLGSGGEFQGYVGCCLDVSDRRVLERRLKRMERTEAIGQLSGGIAHDFNNLLTGIIGHCSLLLEDPSLTPQARGDIGEIQRSADRAAGLTRQLLAFSRRQILSPRILDLNRVLTGTLTAIRGIVGNRIEVVTRVEPELPPVLADPGQLEQALLELASHAREMMPGGGRLELRTAVVRVDQALAARHAGLTAGEHVTLAVADTGSGMDAAALEHVFEPFYRGGEQRSGLGLASVYGIVKQSGGYIAVESAPGEGATFTIYLPRQESAPGAAPRSSQELPVAVATETVLLVEDEDQLRELGRRVLERAGYTVLAAADAEAAVALADRHPGHIHLLVTDVLLPRAGGRELAARLGIHRPAIKVLYVSGTSDDAVARHRLLEPGTEFLEKPFSLDRLLQKVRQALGAPEAASRPG